MWELDCEKGWELKNWCFWTVVLEKTLETPLDCKEIQPVHSEDQPWDFFGRNDAKAETPVLWSPHAKSWLIGKDSDAGRHWGQEEKGTTEDEMAGWHHWLDGHESQWTPGVGDGQGGLACCDSWGRKESDTTKRLNWTELNWNNYSKIQIVWKWVFICSFLNYTSELVLNCKWLDGHIFLFLRHDLSQFYILSSWTVSMCSYWVAIMSVVSWVVDSCLLSVWPVDNLYF